MTVAEIAALGTIGVSLGALAFNAIVERQRKQREKRTDAYVDFLKAISMIATPDKSSDTYREGQTLSLEARHRILLYGGKDVIECLEAYYAGRIEGHWSHLEGPGRDNYANLIAAMQKDCRGSTTGSRTILTVVVDEAKSEKLLPP